MRKTTALKSSLIAAAALASALGLVGSASASTTGTWTVAGFPASGSTTGTSTNTVLTDTVTGTQLSCTTSTDTVHGVNASGQPGTNLAQVTGATWTNCSGPFGITFAVTPQNLSWHLNAVSYDSATGITSGNLTGIEAHISGVGCTADFRGTTSTASATVQGTYNNNTHTLTVLAAGTDLHAYNVSGSCAGLLNNNDPVTYTGDYTTADPIKITSP